VGKQRTLSLLLAALAAACASRRLTPVPAPTPQPQANLERVHLSLREFNLVGQGENDTPIDVERLEERFLDYVESTASFREVAYDLEGRLQPEEPALELSVTVALEERTERTWALDALNVPFVGMWPLVPAWGEARVEVSVALAPPGDGARVELRERVSAPYSSFFYSWYRSAPLEDAFARATAKAFARIAVAMPSAVASALDGEVASPVAVADQPTGTLAPIVDWPAELPHEGVRVIEERPPPEGGVLALVLGTLGGVEVAGFKGLARVSSKAFLESGAEAEVASGTATQTGYRIGLYSAPDVTSWFIYPALGYVSQKIDNVDTRSQLFQLNQMMPPDPRDIGAIATDPTTGGDIDAGVENVYHLDMQSGYAGVRVGASLVAGSEWLEVFGSFSLGVNLVEYRSIRSVLDNCDPAAPPSACRTKHRGWDFVQSGAIGATLGVRLPEAHTALRFIFDYEYYRQFEYERPLDVRGPAVYDPVNRLFQHEMLSMEGASLSSASFQLALAVVY
jgi:hypothetical protein